MPTDLGNSCSIHKIPTVPESGEWGTVFTTFLFIKNVLPFPGGLENTYSHVPVVPRPLREEFEHCSLITVTVLEVYKKSVASTYNLSVFSRCKNVSPEKQKKLWIYLTLFNRFWQNFHQIDCTVSDSSNTYNRWPWKSRPVSELSKKLNFKARISKQTSNRISLWHIGNLKILRISQFCRDWPNDICFSFLQLFCFHLFPKEERVENNDDHRSQRLFNIFSNILWIVTGVLKTRVLCKMCTHHWKSAGGCRTTYSLRSPSGKLFASKKRNRRISLALLHRFSLIFHHMLKS